MNTLEILEKARAKIAKGWCVGKRGQDANGTYCNGNSPRALQVCALGAVDYALDITDCFSHKDAQPALRALYQQLPRPYSFGSDVAGEIAVFNNSTSQKDVLALFDHAIEKAKEECHVELA